jgi:hypothetical protein
MPAALTYASAADYVFDVPVAITCTVCGTVIEPAARDVADAMGAAREHEHEAGSSEGEP